MMALKECLGKLTQSISPRALFPTVPTIRVEADINECLHCHNKLKVKKTDQRMVSRLEIGTFHAHITVLHCEHCGLDYVSDSLDNLVPNHCNYGYDVLVAVGRGLFVDYKNERQLQCELASQNIQISLREIGYLGKKFICYLSLAHQQSQTQLKQWLHSQGGYILHLDGTCEGDSPHLMSALDGIKEIVLSNIKLPSENSDQIIPFLKKIKKTYGNPIALVHDMGKGILLAVSEVFPGVKDFICHYHFLRDIGKDLFEGDHILIKNYIKKHHIRTALRMLAKKLKARIYCDHELRRILTDCEKKKKGSSTLPPAITAYLFVLWILDFKTELGGYGFPFDRPHLVFFKRLLSVDASLKSLSSSHKNAEEILKLKQILSVAMKDQTLTRVALLMAEKTEIFDELRAAMRIALPGDKQGLNDDGNDIDMSSIKKKVVAFRQSEKIQALSKNHVCYKKMVKQIDVYWEKLFSDPIKVKTPMGTILIQPQRTNNLLERLFRGLKRGLRRRGGTCSLTKTLRALIADTPLVKNLNKPEYLKIILKGTKNLEERFVQIDAQLVRKEMKSSDDKIDRVPTSINNILRMPKFLAKFEKTPRKSHFSRAA
ncbi:MAG: transposase [bacterium]